MDRRTLIVSTLLAGAGVAATATVPAAAAHIPAPTNGSGGSLTDHLWGDYTDQRGINAGVHRWGGHLTGLAGPFPLIIHLHGDGGDEYRNPTTSTSPEYAQVAEDHGALCFIPQSPYRSNGYTWWHDYNSTQWLADFIGWAGWRYNIDRQRIYLSGFSGGAETLAFHLVADRHDLFLGGGAMMLGGGGAWDMSITGTGSSEVRARFLMRWHTGDLDDERNTSDGFNALDASAIGERKYREAGWNARRVLIPGADHDASEYYGPAALRSLVVEHRNLIGV